MIYTTIANSVVTRDYKLFCVMMDISYGPGTKYRSPAESRTVAQFLLSVNTGRRAVFINFNRGIAAIVEARNVKPSWWSDDLSPGHKLSRDDRRRINLYNSTFEGSSKELRAIFSEYHSAFTKEVQRYSWQHPILSKVLP